MLVVEDDVAYRHVVTRLLKIRGYQMVVVAKRSDSRLQSLREHLCMIFGEDTMALLEGAARGSIDAGLDVSASPEFGHDGLIAAIEMGRRPPETGIPETARVNRVTVENPVAGICFRHGSAAASGRHRSVQVVLGHVHRTGKTR